LKQQLEEEDLDAATETCETILQQSHGDNEASRTLIAVSLQNSDFKRALALLKNFPSMRFEKAYALYRTYEEKTALDTLKSVPKDQYNEATYHLLAQIFYRLGEFDKCAEVYEKNFQVEEMDVELQANLLAAYANSHPTKALKFVKNLAANELTHELAYNAACAFIDAGELNMAYQKLEQAKKLCRATLEADEASPEEIKDELAVLTVQQAYVLQCQGKPAEALQLYLQVLEEKPSDEAVVATASNNIITLRKKDEKIFDSLKRSNKAASVSSGKLSLRQQRAIQSNKCLLLLYGKKGDQSREAVENLRKEFPGSEVPVLVLASMYYREKNMDKCDAVLDNYIKSSPHDCLQAKLTKAHILLLQGKLSECTEALKALGAPLCYRPGVVATIVSLYDQLGNTTGAVAAQKEAVEYWKNKKEDSQISGATISKIFKLILEESAEYHISRGMEAEATLQLEQLVKLASADDRQFYLSKLVVAAAQNNDASAAAKYAANLPNLDLGNIDIDALEAADFLSKRRMRDSNTTKRPRDAEIDEEEKKKEQEERLAKKRLRRKKKRKIRYPKDFDPENPGPMPDPERWLPRHERSNYKKKGRKRRDQGIARGPQGTSLANKDDMPDVFQGVSQEEKDAAAAKATSTKSASASARMQARKKKKGRR